jgi:hypothetical protein
MAAKIEASTHFWRDQSRIRRNRSGSLAILAAMGRSAGMVEVPQFISANSGFDPEVIAIPYAAYNRATAELHDRGHARVRRETSVSALSPWR